MAKHWRYWHKVLGLTLGTVLLVISLSGTILIFKQDLIELNVGKNYEASEYNVATLAKGLEKILMEHKAENIFYMKTPSQGRRYWFVALHNDEQLIYSTSGNIIEDRWNILPILHWLGHLHTELLLPNSGTTWLTLLGIGVLILTTAGLISWWPGRRGFRFTHLWQWPARRGPALRQHRAIAIFCMPLLVLSVITGGGMSVQSSIRFVLSPWASEKELKIETQPKPEYLFTNDDIISTLIDAQEELPGWQITMLGMPNPATPELRLRFRSPGEWHINGKTAMRINMKNGDLALQRVDQASRGRRILNTFYPLHSSYGMPIAYVALVTATGVLTMFIGYLGWLAWLKRRNKKPAKLSAHTSDTKSRPEISSLDADAKSNL